MKFREVPQNLIFPYVEDKRPPPNVKVVPLTHDLCTRMKVAAAASLNGDGTCSLKAMSMSCFASEACAKNTLSNMTLDLLMMHDIRFVAMEEERGDFVGCVSAQRIEKDTMCRRFFPNERIGEGCLVLYNLCVSYEHRGCGAGRKLVDEVIREARSPECVYLLVSKLNPHEKEAAKRKIYMDRVNRLLSTYAKLKFNVVCDCEECYLLRHL